MKENLKKIKEMDLALFNSQMDPFIRVTLKKIKEM